MAVSAYRKASSRFSSMGGDGEDQYVSLCFRGVDPMETSWNDFEGFAKMLFTKWIELGAKA